jgi:hypothetical protein
MEHLPNADQLHHRYTVYSSGCILKFSLILIKHQPIKTYRGLSLIEVSSQLHAPAIEHSVQMEYETAWAPKPVWIKSDWFTGHLKSQFPPLWKPLPVHCKHKRKLWNLYTPWSKLKILFMLKRLILSAWVLKADSSFVHFSCQWCWLPLLPFLHLSPPPAFRTVQNLVVQYI